MSAFDLHATWSVLSAQFSASNADGAGARSDHRISWRQVLCPDGLICLKTVVSETVLGFLTQRSEDSDMSQPKFEVPAEVRNMAEKAIEQAEKAFGMFLDAANKSLASIPLQTTEVSQKALSFTEQNMKAAFDHAKQVVQTTDLQEAMRIQSEFLKSQFTNASEQIKKITGEIMSAAKDATKDKS
jgi:phasin